MENNKPELKLHVKYELSYEIIFVSSFIILFGIAYVFASNLLTFNWFTVIFGLLAIAFIYLKHQSYLQIDNDILAIVYFKFFTKEKVQLITVSEFVFYENSRLVEVKSSDQVLARVYLTKKNKEKLLNYMVNHYSDIPCIYYD